MASVIVFPNVATHRKLPHLQPKDTHKDKTPSSTAAKGESSQDAINSGLQHLALQDGHHQQQPQLAQGQQRPLIQDTAGQVPRLVEPEARHALTVDTQPPLLSAPAAPLPPQHKDLTHVLSASSSASSLTSSGQTRPPSSMVESPYSALPPSGLPSSSSSSSNGSGLSSAAVYKQPSHHHHSAELLKTAIYDAFGCLYHPMQHTHPSSSSASKSSLTATAAALRSGEVTPLLGLSPRASPRLLPQGTSGPITPLELSDENAASAHAGGYFGITPTSSAQATAGKQGGGGSGGGVAGLGTGAGGGGSSSGGHLEGHHHHHHHHHHQHKPHTSSHLHTASSFSSDNEEGDEVVVAVHKANGHGRRSRPRSAASSRPSSAMLRPDTPMNPVEHPVLNTLQSMAHHHALPGYLDHDLGHDRIPLPSLPAPVAAPVPIATPVPVSVSSVLSTTASPSQVTGSSGGANNTQVEPLEQTKALSTTTATTPPASVSDRSSLPATSQQPQLQPPVFAMDREGPIPDGLGHQKLV